ncbi:MAG: AAA family ATPase [Pyrobaculum sp.]
MKTIRLSKLPLPLPDRILLVGPPGVGKTEVVKQLAAKEAALMNREFVDLREADEVMLEKIVKQPERYYVYLRVLAPHIFPEDLGVPRSSSNTQHTNYVEFVPPKTLFILTLSGIAGLLFLDELSNVQREDQLAMYYSLILEKEFGWGARLSSGVKIVAAANDQEWSEIVRPLPKPLRNRLIIVKVTQPSVDEWLNYMYNVYGDEWERLIATYLRVFPEDLLQPPEDDWEPFPTPRSWTQLAITLHKYRDADEEFLEAVILGTLGRRVGIKFATIYKQRKNIDELIDDVLKHPARFSELKIEDRILVVTYLSQQSVDVLKEKAEKLIAWMAENAREWLVTMFAAFEPKKRMEAIRKLQSIKAVIDIIKGWK